MLRKWFMIIIIVIYDNHHSIYQSQLVGGFVPVTPGCVRPWHFNDFCAREHNHLPAKSVQNQTRRLAAVSTYTTAIYQGKLALLATSAISGLFPTISANVKNSRTRLRDSVTQSLQLNALVIADATHDTQNSQKVQRKL